MHTVWSPSVLEKCSRDGNHAKGSVEITPVEFHDVYIVTLALFVMGVASGIILGYELIRNAYLRVK